MNSTDRTHGRIAAGAIAAGLACALALGGCSQTSTSSASATTSAASTTASSSDGTTLTATKAADLDVSNMFTDKDLSGNYENGSAVTITLADNASTASSSAGVSISGNVITISKGGTYVVTGSLTDGQIVVDAGDSDKVQIVLEGVTITNSALPAVYVKSADKTFLTVEGGQASSLATTGTIAQASDDKADATVFSHDDLTINGTGTLSVSSAQGHAIVSKDDLVCAGVTLNVTASGSGLKANNSVRIASGTYNIKVDTDAIHADTSSDALGYVYVAGGTLTVNAGDDAVHAEGATRVDGGTIDIQSCYEGLEGQTVLQTAGDVSIVSTDDSVNAASPSTTSGTADTGMGGTPSATAGSDFHGGGAPGMDANATSATSGATGSGDASGGGGMGLGMANDVDDSCDLTISGGTLTCTTGGDGLDSNGTLEVSGGTVRVWGP
ncbi:MAG: carbohydrate-binding domain-containing protein, partial [Atopobiaceae bacterium]